MRLPDRRQRHVARPRATTPDGRDLVDDAEGFLDTCDPASQELLPWVGTNNAARDLDLLRAALGDERLTYVGYSYGTRLGSTYAELFPDRVRALVLDGAVKPTTDSSATDEQNAIGFDRALEHFATACDADDDCLLGEIGPTLDVIDDLRAEIQEVGSFPTDDPARVLTPGELTLGVFAALYSESYWPFLVLGLYVAETDQDGSILQVLADLYSGRRYDGTYENLNEANVAINCADDADAPHRRRATGRGRCGRRSVRALPRLPADVHGVPRHPAGRRSADRRAGCGSTADPRGGHHR